jgi:hypothetical protein
VQSKNNHKNKERKKTKNETNKPNWRINVTFLFDTNKRKIEPKMGNKTKIGNKFAIQNELNILNFLILGH